MKMNALITINTSVIAQRNRNSQIITLLCLHPLLPGAARGQLSIFNSLFYKFISCHQHANTKSASQKKTLTITIFAIFQLCHSTMRSGPDIKCGKVSTFEVF